MARITSGTGEAKWTWKASIPFEPASNGVWYGEVDVLGWGGSRNILIGVAASDSPAPLSGATHSHQYWSIASRPTRLQVLTDHHHYPVEITVPGMLRFVVVFPDPINRQFGWMFLLRLFCASGAGWD